LARPAKALQSRHFGHRRKLPFHCLDVDFEWKLRTN
jgi:hypothetical protein